MKLTPPMIADGMEPITAAIFGIKPVSYTHLVFVGCDRVAANGDAANKIGTSVVAAVAKYYGVPVYICAPTSTIDLNTLTGAEIKIEQRPAEEVTEMWYKERMAPEGIKVFNLAFDVTDHELIAGIVTEYGVARAPYTCLLYTSRCV